MIDICVLDINYISDINRQPIIQLFGIDEFNISHIIKVYGFKPYFYARSSDIIESTEKIERMGLEFEIVERFKPIGYQTNPIRMIKIYTISPKDVREVREQIKSIPTIIEIYEADVLFHDRFAADTDISCMTWISVESDSIYYRDIKILDSHEEVTFKILSLDIECLPPENGFIPIPENDPITMVSLSFNRKYNNSSDLVLIAKPIECKRNDILSFESEKDLLKCLRHIIKEYDPDIITGYNIESFDLNYIDVRSKVNSVPYDISRDNSNMYIRKFGTNTEVMVAGRIIIDTLQIIRRTYSLDQYTLKNVSDKLLHIQKLDVPASKMREYWLDNGQKFIDFIKYSRRDSVLGLHLLTDLGLLRKNIALSVASGLLLQNIVRGGQTQMLEFMILKRFNRSNRVVNMKPDISGDHESEFEGAYVSVPKKALCENLILTDMQSLYPSIIIRYNLCPSTLISEEESKYIISPDGTKFTTEKRGILPEMLDELLKKRLETKQLMKKSTNEDERNILDSIQYSYKILLNSAYGLCGYPRSRTFARSVASSVTAYGRETIKGVRNSIENIKNLEINDKKFNFEVIYTDTDSAYVEVKCNEKFDPNEADLVGNEVAKIVSSPMSYPMKLNYEGYASRALFLTKKRYAMNMTTKQNNEIKYKIKVKGIEVVRRDWCKLVGETMSKILSTILIDGDVQSAWQHSNKVLNDVLLLKDIRTNKDLAEKLVLSRKIGNLASYKNVQPHVTVYNKIVSRGEQPPGLGDRIAYMALPGALKDGISLNVDTPDHILETDGRIDNHWYVENQIKPPLERVFDAIGIDMMTGKKKLNECSLFGFKEGQLKVEDVIGRKEVRKAKTGLFAFGSG